MGFKLVVDLLDDLCIMGNFVLFAKFDQNLLANSRVVLRLTGKGDVHLLKQGEVFRDLSFLWFTDLAPQLLIMLEALIYYGIGVLAPCTKHSILSFKL